jgi:glycosyltransferase involved in cell wall biosynthesis
MRILIGSPAFPPSLGGLERFVEQLATGLAERGDEVTVMTSTPAPQPDRYPFRVVRCPGPFAKLRLVRECEVFFQANVSLKDLWPLLLVRRPWVVVHQGLYTGNGWRKAAAAAKQFLARRSTRGISASRYVAGEVDPESEVIPNPYDDRLFRIVPGVARDADLLFVGRLVSDKGADVLVRALARLAAAGCRSSLSVVGAGPEESRLRDQVAESGLTDQVVFRGRLDGEELVREMNRHRILVVPSVWEEPFGIVALEGIACGCVVVGTARGGLVEAIGPCGVVVPNGDEKVLAATLKDLLEGADSSVFQAAAAEHLRRHQGGAIVERYREVIRSAFKEAAG